VMELVDVSDSKSDA